MKFNQRSELEAASQQNASQSIGRVLADPTNKSIDVIAFDANPDNGVRPAGLLNGVFATASAPAGAFVAETVAADVANLVGAIGNANIDPSDVQLIAGPREVTWLNYAGSAATRATRVPARHAADHRRRC